METRVRGDLWIWIAASMKGKVFFLVDSGTDKKTRSKVGVGRAEDVEIVTGSEQDGQDQK